MLSARIDLPIRHWVNYLSKHFCFCEIIYGLLDYYYEQWDAQEGRPQPGLGASCGGIRCWGRIVIVICYRLFCCAAGEYSQLGIIWAVRKGEIAYC